MDYDYPEIPPHPSASSAPRLPYFHINDANLQDVLGGSIMYDHGAGDDDPDEDDESDENDQDDVMDDMGDEARALFGLPAINPFARSSLADTDTPFLPQDDQASSDDDDDDSSSASGSPMAMPLPTEDLGEGRREAAPRGRGRPRGRGGRRGGLKALLAKTDPDRHLKAAARGAARGRPRGRGGVARGEGGRGGRKGKRALKLKVEPSKEFKGLQAQATTAFLDKKYEDALEYAVQAVENNPEIFAAHSLLSQIYYEMGKKEESLGVLWSGAHTQRQPGVWWEVANRTTEMNYTNKALTEKQLVYCFSQIARLDPDDFDAHKGKLDIFMRQEIYGRSIRECIHMVRLRPHDLDTLQTMAGLCMKSNEQKKAKIAYDKAIIHYQSVQLDEYGGEFSFSDLNIYLELFMSMQEWSDGLKAVKSVARWLCGRKSETFWDLRDDDCEWDLEHEPRRTALPNFDSSAHKLDAYGQALLPEIRAKMGIFRLHLGRTQLEEALRHFELFYPDDEGDEATVFEYADLFREIAEALRGERHYKEALRFYEPLQRVQKVLEVSIMKNMAECYSKTFNFERAIVCWEGVLQTDDSNVDVLMELAKAYEASGDSAKAYKHLAHLMRLGRRDVIQRSGLNIQPVVADRYATQSMPLLLPKPSSTSAVDDSGQAGTIVEAQGTEHIVLVDQRKTRPYKMRKPGGESTRQRVRHQARYLLSLYDESEELKPAMRAGDESAEQQWMDAAQILTDALREEKLFFPADRYIKFLGYSTEARRRAIHPRERNELLEMADRLQTNLGTNKDADDNDFGNLNPVDETQFIPTSYHGIEFTAWLDLSCEYALRLALHSQATECYTLLESLTHCNIFYHTESSLQHIHVCILRAALILNDEERLCNTARFFIKATPYVTDTFRLYAALNRLLPSPPSWYNSGPAQKFMMRTLRLMDYALVPPDSRGPFNFPLQIVNASAGDPIHPDASHGNPHGIKTVDAALLTLYGHFLVSAASYTNALNYYFRALATDRGNAMTVLSIALAYMQYSMKRQCENRQHAVAMAVGFFRMYRTVRLGEVEVEVGAEGGVDNEAESGASLGESDTPSASTAKSKARWIRSQRLMEVELNEGRFWHHLGLLHLAIPAYERCLAVAHEPPPQPHTRPQADTEASPPRPNENSACLDDAMDIDIAIDTDTSLDRRGDTVMQDNDFNEGADQAGDTAKDAFKNTAKDLAKDQANDENKNKPNPEPQPKPQPQPEDETEPAVEPEPDFKMEAAFALQHIWALGGDVARAREITREWLVY